MVIDHELAMMPLPSSNDSTKEAAVVSANSSFIPRLSLECESGDVNRSLHKRMDFAMICDRAGSAEGVGKRALRLYMPATWEFAVVGSHCMGEPHLVSPLDGVASFDCKEGRIK